ncbi:putative bifunctional diguanylate cyclase/phosphodiesterase [Catenuloplanes atrovinosus]|uniref:Diguanylate cyclase (GGDEF)-like protein n=1 Tax=Catenuloplanes atrovinosus TaxID=137266 RepID=A0AAE3YJE6_9ACTN|nr:EAL domain-containing protein [Catenuloplanes atrovinosus]MDR7273982.1 diguanylate cyclase (GGDEF)-like protein [Catenuloplanes atrovinosus]
MGGGGAARRPAPLLAVATLLAFWSAGWFTVSLAHPFTPAFVGWLAPPLLPLVGAAACRRAAAADRRRGVVRRFWRRFALASALAGLAAAGNAMAGIGATGNGVHRPAEPAGPFVVALYLAGVVVALWALLGLPVRRARRAGPRLAMDMTIVLLATGLFLWYGVLRHTGGGTLSSGALAAVLVLGTLGVAALVAFATLEVGRADGVDPRSLYLLAAALAGGIAAGALHPLLGARADLHPAQLALPVTYLLITVAADRQRHAAGRAGSARGRRESSGLWPFVAVGGTGVLLVTVSWDDPDARVVALVSMALTGIVMARQLLALAENGRLLARVDASLQELRRVQDELTTQATHDALTGLANRTLFERRTRAAMDQLSGDEVLHVALIDLDDFKGVNDRLGHAVGDALLAVVGERLQGCVRSGDTVARLGGDEFAMILEDATPDAATTVMTRVAEVLGQPISAAGHDLLVRASVGLAQAGVGGTPDELLRRADVAMYAAKAAGKGRYAYYSPDLDAHQAADAQLAADLQQAIDSAQFDLLYQPIVRLADRRWIGAEALVRWRHPVRGLISPEEFLSTAERTGLIVPLGDWVLREACAQAVRWRTALGDAAPTIGINVADRQLRETGFAARVAELLRASALPASALSVEITEATALGGGSAIAMVGELSRHGIRVTLDDFGAGASSLDLLRRAPVHGLKIDKAFVRGLEAGTGTQEFVISAALVRIAAGLSLTASAAGVETAGQAEALRDMGYLSAQGYHFAPPLPAEEFTHHVSPSSASLS